MPGAASAERRRKILVVDDQPTLARAIRRMLTEHDVTMVESGHEAFARIQAGERFDLILTDVMMPEMSGMELHRRIAEVAPEQVDRMVFMTGGAFTEQARDFFDRVDNPTIEKPFDRAELMAVIDALLA